MQGELFKKSKYGIAKCIRCGSLGTIVDMGKCCEMAALFLQYSGGAKLESASRLSSHDSDTNETKRKVA